MCKTDILKTVIIVDIMITDKFRAVQSKEEKKLFPSKTIRKGYRRSVVQLNSLRTLGLFNLNSELNRSKPNHGFN